MAAAFPIRADFRPKLLFVGSGLDRLADSFRRQRPVHVRLHAGYELPTEDILADLDAAFVFDVDQRERLEQLRYLCREQMRNGRLGAVIGYSRRLDASLAAAIENAGARFVPLGGGGR